MTDEGRAAPHRAAPERLLFIALLVMWLVIPTMLTGQLAQDATPYLVAGELAEIDPHLVYASEQGDLYTLNPEFARRYCEIAVEGSECEKYSVAFVSTPTAIPFAWFVAKLGPTGGVLFMRVLAAACLAGGMLAIWRRLVATHPENARPVTGATLVLTVFAMVPLALGQTSPFLFLSAALGISGSWRSRWFVPVSSLVWVLAVAFKAWPAALIVLLIWHRRWRFLGWAVGWGAALLVLTLPFRPFELFGGFLRTSSEVSTTAATNPYNGSLEALANVVWSPLTEGAGVYGLVALRVALIAFVWWFGGRHARPDGQWALGYLCLLLVVPLMWWHYVIVVFAAIAVALEHRPNLRHEILILPALAVVAVPISLPDMTGPGWQLCQGVFLIGSTVLVAWLLRGGAARTAAERDRVTGSHLV